MRINLSHEGRVFVGQALKLSKWVTIACIGLFIVHGACSSIAAWWRKPSYIPPRQVTFYQPVRSIPAPVYPPAAAAPSERITVPAFSGSAYKPSPTPRPFVWKTYTMPAPPVCPIHIPTQKELERMYPMPTKESVMRHRRNGQ